MKHSGPAPLYKDAGIKARGKDTGNPCPAVQGHVGLAAVQGWVRAWPWESASSSVGPVEKKTEKKKLEEHTKREEKTEREGEKPQTDFQR